MVYRYARIHRLGIRNLQIDDYLMLLVAVSSVPSFNNKNQKAEMLIMGLKQAWYTILISCLNVIAGGGGSNLYPPELTGTFTPEEVAERIQGSKIVVVSEQVRFQFYILTSPLLPN